VAMAVSDLGWTTVQVQQEELLLSHTLPVGQTFRWVETTKAVSYTGVIGSRAYQLEQLEDGFRYRVVARCPSAKDEEDEEGEDGVEGEKGRELAELREYFQLQLNLSDFISHWSKCDERFKAVKEYYPGARLLRQDPVECLFSFICSSNNHISRIHGMVSTLCRLYGTELRAPASAPPRGEGETRLYKFPTLEQLSEAKEEDLRANGFGYRAKFVTGSVAALAGKPGGGAAWLHSLRGVPYKEASLALQTLPGIGPKVAACICLFSLDKYEAIPVDTHVWRVVVTHYRPDLQEKKSLTPRLMDVAQEALQETFGPHAGWAHNVLFLAELAELKKRLPEKLQTPTKRKQATPKKKKTSKMKTTEAADVKAETPIKKKKKGKKGGEMKQAAKKNLAKDLAKEEEERAGMNDEQMAMKLHQELNSRRRRRRD